MSSCHCPKSSCSHAQRCHCIHVPGPRGQRGLPGSLIDFAEFYTLPSDANAPPVEVSSKVEFKTDGVSLGGGQITRNSADTFLLQPGTYEITWTVPVLRVRGSQNPSSNILQLNVNGVVQPNSVTGLPSDSQFLNTKTVLYHTSSAVLAFVEVPTGKPTYIVQGAEYASGSFLAIPSTLVINCIARP